MKPLKRAAVLVTCAMLLTHVGCDSTEQGGKADVALTKETALHPLRVSVTEVTKRDFNRSVQFTGTLQAKNHVGLRALVEGTIDRIPVEIGDQVRKGQLLFQIRLVDYELRVRQAEAAVQAARAAVHTSQVNVEDAKREMRRMEGLYKEGSATEQMRDRARTAQERAVALLEQARASVVQAQVGLDTARQALKDCTVTAPYPGFVTGKFYEKGEYVHRGQVVVEIMDLATLEADIALPERYFENISPGAPVSISVGSGEIRVEGKVIAVNQKIDPQTRTFLVKVGVDNREGRLKAGLFCSGSMSLPSIQGATAVPSAAVLNDEGRSYVWVASGGKAERRPVRTGVSAGKFIQIIEGLQPGEKVVVEGTGGLMDGNPIEIVAES